MDPAALAALHQGKPVRRVASAWLDNPRRRRWQVPGLTDSQAITIPRTPARVRPDLATAASTLRVFTARELALAAGAAITSAHAWLGRNAHRVTSTTVRVGRCDTQRFTLTDPPCAIAPTKTPAPGNHPHPAIPSPTSTPKTPSPASPPPAPPAATTGTTTAPASPAAAPFPFTDAIMRLVPRHGDGVGLAWLTGRLRLRPASMKCLLARIPALALTTNRFGAPCVVRVDHQRSAS